jgi:hypothetical protein
MEKIEQTVGEIRNHAGPSQPPYQPQGQPHPHPRQGGFQRGGRGRGGFQGGPGQGQRMGGPGPAPPVIPAEEYDFEQMNRKFEEMRTREQKPEVVLSSSKSGQIDGQAGGDDDSEDESDEEVVMGKKGDKTAATSGLRGDDQEQVEPVYNKSKSFFDSVSSDVSANNRQGGGRGGRGGALGGFDAGGRGGGGGGFKWQRSQERMTNLNTFGEAGGNNTSNHYHNGGGRGRGGFPRGRGRGGGGGGYRGPAPGLNNNNGPQQQQPF